jgi:DNA-binding MarR family transcriptional regulator
MDLEALLAPQCWRPARPSRARGLALLRAAGSPLGVHEVAGHTGLHPNTARFHLDGLVEAGLATREPRPRMTPTAAGRRVARRIRRRSLPGAGRRTSADAARLIPNGPGAARLIPNGPGGAGLAGYLSAWAPHRHARSCSSSARRACCAVTLPDPARNRGQFPGWVARRRGGGDKGSYGEGRNAGRGTDKGIEWPSRCRRTQACPAGRS